ncbi:MAG: DUF2752 domain-containing protein [Akkermansiaceae bacterium]
MKPRPLWPLLPPLAAVVIIGASLGISRLFGGASCVVQKHLGVHCPGCGGTRCAYDIARGNWLQALDHNLLLGLGFFSLMLLFFYLIVRITILGKTSPRFPNITARWMWAALGLIVAFTILRNIPHPLVSWLAP